MVKMNMVIGPNKVPIERIGKKIKHVYIRYESKGKILVTHPKTMSISMLESILMKHLPKMENHIRTYQAKKQDELTTLLIQGIPTQLIRDPFTQHCFLSPEGFHIPPSNPSLAIEQYFINYTLAMTKQAYQSWKHAFPQGVLKDIVFESKRMKRSLGICYPSRKKIIMNSMLGRFQPIYLEVTLVHELCHLLEANHSKAFWNQVFERIPNYKHLYQELSKQFSTYEGY